MPKGKKMGRKRRRVFVSKGESVPESPGLGAQRRPGTLEILLFLSHVLGQGSRSWEA